MRTPSAFDLPDALHAKADPALVADDEVHFAAIADSIEHQVAELEHRLDVARRSPAGSGQAAVERDQEIHRTTARLRTLRRYGIDLCLGRVVGLDGTVAHVGRLGLTDAHGRRLLVDWRSPAAEPFFGATHANPMGLASRRRYRWAHGRVVDFWDEVFTADALEGHAALDDQSAFVASLGAARSDRMRDVLGTIQADQDAIVRAGSRGALVVDGGPGTGKTVVALHRTAYLLYADPRLGHRRGGVLFVGPHQPYLAYVADVLPSLGEEGVRTCTLRDLVPEGASAVEESDPRVADLKARAAMVDAIEPAVALYEQPPTQGILVETPVADVWISPEDWAEAFGAVDPGTPHNEARDEIWDALLAIAVDKAADELTASAEGGDRGGPWGAGDVLAGAGPDEDWLDGGDLGDVGLDGVDEGFDAYGAAGRAGVDPVEALRSALAVHPGLVGAFGRAWPVLEATDLVGDLWAVPAYLRRCAPWLSVEEVGLLGRAEGSAWTVSDLALLDAARRRLGDAGVSGRRRRAAAAREVELSRRADVVEDLVASDGSDMRVMSMLRGQDLRAALVDVEEPVVVSDGLAGPFAHVVVDEAQELSDAQWRMLLARCPSGSVTVVGDRAQARAGFAESWGERLARVGVGRVRVASLSVNYRTPVEVMGAAEPVIRAVLPDANVPTSVRRAGVPVRFGRVAELGGVLAGWAGGAGTVCVVAVPDVVRRVVAPVLREVGSADGVPGAGSGGVRVLSPALVKGLEFDRVVLVEPEGFGEGVAGGVDRYVAMTRATQELVVLAGS
ncbi:DNA helicase IV [Sediminihabitans luteus]|uniref:DNA helicase IV n=1 Tax=Sediminihabitans luteus TaxID=1138585 RepID=A0A2M9CQS1_9CELL|nr:AAA family ATPase [Sediminihabitans luteus]PJJ74254.1 DNA helicase IV [Sediminihabitans luteus]GII99107.1 DNA helicase [Sediminihabitans luteus]